MKPVGAPPFHLPDRYKYAGKTLSGGQGAVYICRDENLQRDVAVKALHTVSNSIALKKEIEARGKIKSKHVVEIYDVFATKDGVPFALVLEYVPGETLQEKASIPDALEGKLMLLYQLACGLADIHEAGVIHRDIKPLNIKVDGAQILKIFDLGLANLDADAASTVGGAGTHVFGAPELYLAPSVILSRAVDIYAFGVVAWHVLVAGFPDALLEIPPQHSGNPIPSLASYVGDLGHAAPVLDRCLLVDPAGRPAASEIVEALRQLITKGRRRGIFAWGASVHELSKPGNVTTLKVGALGTVQIAHDGVLFLIKDFSGNVAVNNLPASIGLVLPESCVLTFGTGATREFIPFNVSQPQIVV